jgi:hypothetical protein
MVDVFSFVSYDMMNASCLFVCLIDLINFTLFSWGRLGKQRVERSMGFLCSVCKVEAEDVQ